MSENVKRVSTDLKMLRIAVSLSFAAMVFHVVDSVAHGIPISEVFVNRTSMLFGFSVVLFIYGLLEIDSYRNQKKAQDSSSPKESTTGTNADNQQQTFLKNIKNTSFSEKVQFLLGVCCGVATTAVLFWLLFDRVLYSVIFS